MDHSTRLHRELQASPLLRPGGWRGFSYVSRKGSGAERALPAELEGALDGWLAAGRVEGAAPLDLEAGKVFRSGPYLVKFNGPTMKWSHRLLAGPSIRAAHTALDLPVATPRPFLALQRGGFFQAREGLLVTEFVEGELLERFWREDAHAMERFAEFMAALATHRVFHGDFHWRNMIWSAERDEWHLLDLEGLRYQLRARGRRRPLVLDQWARLDYCLGRPNDDLRPHFDAFLGHADLGWNATQAWSEVQARAEHHEARWGAPWISGGTRSSPPTQPPAHLRDKFS